MLNFLRDNVCGTLSNKNMLLLHSKMAKTDIYCLYHLHQNECVMQK